MKPCERGQVRLSVNGMAGLSGPIFLRGSTHIRFNCTTEPSGAQQRRFLIWRHPRRRGRNGREPNGTESGRVGDGPSRATSALSKIYGRRRRRRKTNENENENEINARKLARHPHKGRLVGCQGRTQGGINEFIPRKLSKLDLTAAAEYVANLVNVNMWL